MVQELGRCRATGFDAQRLGLDEGDGIRGEPCIGDSGAEAFEAVRDLRDRERATDEGDSFVAFLQQVVAGKMPPR